MNFLILLKIKFITKKKIKTRKYIHQNGVKIIEMAVPKYNERLPLYLAKKRTVLYYFVFYTLY